MIVIFINQILQSSLQSSTLLEIGNVIRNSELSEVEENVDLIIQHLLDTNKVGVLKNWTDVLIERFV